MERNFNGIEVTPEELMAYRVQSGKLPLYEYMLWLMTDRTMDSVKDSIMKQVKDDLARQNT